MNRGKREKMKYIIGLVVYTLILSWAVQYAPGFAAVIIGLTVIYAYNEA